MAAVSGWVGGAREEPLPCRQLLLIYQLVVIRTLSFSLLPLVIMTPAVDARGEIIAIGNQNSTYATSSQPRLPALQTRLPQVQLQSYFSQSL